MSVLQTIDLKKHYGAEPNITRGLITKPAIVLADEPTGSVTLVQHYPKETPVILFSLSILISFIADRQSVRFSSRVSVS